MVRLTACTFKVKDLEGNEIITIDGGNVNLGGWVLDKLAFKDHSTGQKFCSVERRALAGAEPLPRPAAGRAAARFQ